jgi:hypothetical protein
MAVSSLTAIEFIHFGIRHARVFYQYNDDKTLRESCYQKDYGWFVRGDGVITRDAEEHSPITAACWLDGSGVTQVSSFLTPYYNHAAQDWSELTCSQDKYFLYRRE